jgi:plasmid stabilization system protein ParE
LKFTIEESDRFLKDVEESAVWILLSNVEQSEAFAENRLSEFEVELNALKDRLVDFPESGESDDIQSTLRACGAFNLMSDRPSGAWLGLGPFFALR